MTQINQLFRSAIMRALVLPILLVCSAVHTNGQNIVTYAGTGVDGNTGDGGLATAAQIGEPGAICSDAAGNIYFSSGGGTIRKVTPAGYIYTIAGTGVAGFSGDGGPATAAQVNYPTGMAVDASGNLFIADRFNNRIRVINTSGIISTYGGDGSYTSSGDGGLVGAAKFRWPSDIAFDGTGNMYIADEGAHKIRKVNTSGIITTIAGTGTSGFSGDGGVATLAKFNAPVTLSVDGAGNIYVADYYNNRIRKINTSGIISTVAGNGTSGYGGDGGPATAAMLANVWGITVSADGTMYIGDGNNHVIRKVSTAGTITTVAGTNTAGYSGDGGPATAAMLNLPQLVALDAYGNIYIDDQYNHRIRKVLVCPPPLTGTISGTSSIAAGNTATLSSTVAGGTWSSSNTTVATVDASTGMVTAVAMGSADILYTVTGGCGSATAVHTITVTGAASVPCFMPTGDLLVWLPFTGNVADSSGHGLDGINIGAALTTDRFGTANSAYYFDGTGNYIDVPYSTSFNTPQATWNIWYKLDQPNDNGITGRFIWGSDFGGGEHITNMILSDVPEIQIAAGGAYNLANTGETVTDDNWHMLTTTYDQAAGQMKIYQDGVYKSSAPVSPFTWSGGAIRFGLSTDPYWQKYLGALDDAALYTRVLSADEIMQMYTGMVATPVISGGNATCLGGSITLSSNVAGGSWSSSDAAVATVDAVTGVVTGVGAGTAMISYTLVTGCSTVYDTAIFTTVTDLTGVTISAPDIDVCPGTPATVDINGPAGAMIVYKYQLRDHVGIPLPDLDTTYTVVLDASGHAVVSVPNTAVHAGEVSSYGFYQTEHTYSVLNATLAGCSAATSTSTVTVAASYLYAEWQMGGSGEYLLDPESSVRSVCAGSEHTATLLVNAGSTAVIKFTNLRTLVTSYDTLTSAFGVSSISIPTGPINDSISYTVMALSFDGCDNFNMGYFTLKYKPLPPSSMYFVGITNSTAPDDYNDVYPQGPFAPTCTGTYRNLRVEVDGIEAFGGSTATTPFVTYSINGGAPQNANIGEVIPSGTIINTGVISADQHYQFISVTNDAGCATPVSDTFFIPVLVHPSASVSAVSSVCAGESVTLTITGTPSQMFNLFVNGADSTYVMGASGVFIATTGPLSATAEVVLANGFYENEGDCMTDYNDTSHIVVNPLFAGTAITSASTVCTGSSITLAASNAGGSWSVSNANASVSGSVLTGVTPGTATLTYMVSNSCSADTAVQEITVVPSLTSAITISPASVNVCPGETTTLDISGPVGTSVTYAYHFEDSISWATTDDVLTTTIGASGHTMIPVITEDLHPGGSITGMSGMSYTYTLQSASLGTCAASDISYLTSVVHAGYITADLELPGPFYDRWDGEYGVCHTVCPGVSQIIHVRGTPAATVVIKTRVIATSAVTYDTVLIPGSGVYDFSTGPIVQNVAFELVGVTKDGCDKFWNNNYRALFGAFETPEMSYKTLIRNGEYPLEIEVYNDTSWLCSSISGTFKPYMYGTQVAVDPWGGAEYYPQSISYSLNGTTVTTPLFMGDFGNVANIPIAADTGSDMIVITEVTTDAGCVYPFSDTTIINHATVPYAALSASTSVCTGSTATITVTGSPNQLLLLGVNGVDNLYNIGSTGVLSLNTGILTSDGIVILKEGTDTRDGNCFSLYSDTATILVNTIPSGTAITSASTICTGSNITLTASNAGGNWSVSNANATVSGDVLTGVAVGTATLSYIVSNSCGADTAVQVLTILDLTPGLFTINSGASSLCPGSSTTMDIAGPAGASVTYKYQFHDDISGVTTEDIFTTTLDGSGHSVIPVMATDIHSGESASSGGNMSYTYTLQSAVLGTCSATLPATASASVVAGYGYAYLTFSGRYYTEDGMPDNHFVCEGWQDTVHVHATAGAIAVIKTATGASAATYDTVTIPVSGVYDIALGSVSDSVSVSVVSVTSGGCDKVLMNTYTSRTRVFPPLTFYNKYMSDPGTPDEAYFGSGLWGGNYGMVCEGTYRTIGVTLNDNVSDLTAHGTGAIINPSTITYTVNGGPAQLANMPGGPTGWGDHFMLSSDYINTGLVTEDLTYIITNFTNSAGCPIAINDTIRVYKQEHPHVTVSVASPVCSGESTTITFTGTPNQIIYYETLGGTDTYSSCLGSDSTFSFTSDPLTASTTFVFTTGWLTDDFDMVCGSNYYDTFAVAVNSVPTGTAITSASTVCTGSNITLTASNAGGSWSVSNANASVSGGVLTGIAPGTATLSYIVSNSCGADTATQEITITSVATAVISGADSICQNASTTLTASGMAGGVWSSANTSVATVNGAGLVYGVGGGITTISYTVSSACGTAVAVHTIKVRAMPLPVTISGADTICVGSTTFISTTSTEGHWDIGLPSVATIDAAGNLTGVAPGTTPLIYRTDVIGCFMAADTMFITVLPTPSAGAISGADSICQNASTTLTASGMTGGTWSSANTSIATVSGSGLVYGVGGGITTISYTVSSACGTAVAVHTIKVRAMPSPVTISGTDTICVGSTTFISTTSTEGHWDIGLPSVATIDAAGNLTGVAPGTTPLIYRTDVIGCFMAADTMFITVLPMPSAGVISGVGSVCTGSSVTLTTTGSMGNWSSSDNLVATVSAGGVVTGISAGFVNISYTVSSACGTAVATHAVTVNASPVAGSITGATSVCAGSDITLSNTAAGTWSSSNALVAGISSTGVVTGVAAGSVTITFTVVSASCGSATALHSVTVNALPVVAGITGTTTVCEGVNSTLGNTTTGGTWLSDNLTVAVVDGVGNVITGVAGTANITYIVTDVNGCTAATSTIYTVNALPDLSAITGSLSVPVGTTAIYTDTASGGTWLSSNTAIATIDAVTGVAGGVAEGLVTITYTKTNGAGCTSTVTLNIAVTDTMGAITISPAGVVVLCHGAPVSLGAVVPGSPVGLSYQWYLDGVAVPGATDSVYMADTPGDISLVVSNGTSTYTVTGVTVVAGPSATVSLTGTNTLYTGSFSTYQWYHNGVAIGGANASIYNAPSSGNYFVVVTDGSGCSDTSNVYYLSPVGVNGVGAQSISVSLYPNPTSSVVHIDAPVSVDIKVTTVDGRVILADTDAKAIDMSKMASGTYMIMVYSREGSLIKAERIVKNQ